MRLRVIRWGALIVACLCLVVFGFDIATQLSSSSRDARVHVNTGAHIEHDEPSLQPLAAFDVVAGRNVFHEKRPNASNEKEKIVTPEVLADPSFGFEVMGTVLSETLDARVAIIMDKRTKEQRLYRVGDLVGDAVILEVRRNRVYINNNGKRELLAVDYQKNMPSRNRPSNPSTRPAKAPRITPTTLPVTRSNPARAQVISPELSGQHQQRPPEKGQDKPPVPPAQ